MKTSASPRPFSQWREDAGPRAEDAAYWFGYFLVEHCRDEAMKTVPKNATDEMRAVAENAVDTALHNLCDLLEGFWPLKAGRKHKIELALGVRVVDAAGEVVETQEISPCKLDLPIGYWKWVREREFR